MGGIGGSSSAAYIVAVGDDAAVKPRQAASTGHILVSEGVNAACVVAVFDFATGFVRPCQTAGVGVTTRRVPADRFCGTQRALAKTIF